MPDLLATYAQLHPDRTAVVDDRPEDSGVLLEADAADVEEQRREVGGSDEDDYR